MIKLRQELDVLLDESLKDKFYFGKSKVRGEGQLTINTKCGNVVIYFSDIVFNRLTKKEIEFIKETIKPRMKDINNKLKKYVELNNKYEQILNKLTANNIKVGWNIYDYTIKVNGINYRVFFNNDITIKKVEMTVSNKEDALKIFDFIEKNLSLIKEFINIVKERNSINEEFNKCSL